MLKLQVGVKQVVGNRYLQLPAGLNLSSDLVCSATRIAAGHEHFVVFVLIMSLYSK